MVFALLTSCSDFWMCSQKDKPPMTRCSLTLLVDEDAMSGIYGKLASSNLYGSNPSWGMVDELGSSSSVKTTHKMLVII